MQIEIFIKHEETFLPLVTIIDPANDNKEFEFKASSEDGKIKYEGKAVITNTQTTTQTTEG